MLDYQLLTAPAYLQDLIKRIDTAQKSVTIIVLMLVYDDITQPLFEAIERALQRSVTVDIAADYFTIREISNGQLSPWLKLSTLAKATLEAQNRLTDMGARWTWLGQRRRVPYSGVCHSKWTVVDDTVYTFGGVNLYGFGIESADYMLRVENAQLAADLRTQFSAVVTQEKDGTPYKGWSHSYDRDTALFDSGIKKDSIIYDRACQLAHQASSILFVSQYCPTGKLASILRATNTEYYYNQPWRTPFFTTNLMLWADSLWTGARSRYRRSRYLHAKFMIFTMPDGDKIALTGSHNFSWAGVYCGTKENAIEIHDTQLCAQLETFWRQEVATSQSDA